MSDTIILAIIAGVPATIAAVTATVAAVSGFRQSDKTDGLIAQTKEIHTLTNSNLSAVSSALAIANEKISGLEKMIAAIKPTDQGGVPYGPR